MITAADEPQNFCHALVELVISERADHIAMRLQCHLQPPGNRLAGICATAFPVRELIQELNGGLVLQQGGSGWRGTDMIAGVNQQMPILCTCRSASEPGRQYGRAAYRPAGYEATGGELSVKVVDPEHFDAHDGIAF